VSKQERRASRTLDSSAGATVRRKEGISPLGRFRQPYPMRVAAESAFADGGADKGGQRQIVDTAGVRHELPFLDRYRPTAIPTAAALMPSCLPISFIDIPFANISRKIASRSA